LALLLLLFPGLIAMMMIDVASIPFFVSKSFQVETFGQTNPSKDDEMAPGKYNLGRV
jgi:hypothetical protein